MPKRLEQGGSFCFNNSLDDYKYNLSKTLIEMKRQFQGIAPFVSHHAHKKTEGY
jgi:hypothetical protein